MGKTRVVAETGAGQHGVATATAAALLGLECVVYMGTEDMARQPPNVHRMKLLGAEVRGVDSGSTHAEGRHQRGDPRLGHQRAHHALPAGLRSGPHPYPTMVRDFQSVIGHEARAQLLERSGALPDVLVACVGGGCNAIGLFYAFLDDHVELVGVEAGGRSGSAGDHAARFLQGAARSGVLHGTRTYLLQDEAGKFFPPTPSPRGSTTPRSARSTRWLRDTGRVRYRRRATTRRSPRSASWPRRRGSSPPWSRRTPSRGSCARRPRWPDAACS